MTKLDYLKERLVDVAKCLKEFAEASKKASKEFEKISDRCSDWHKGRSQAYTLASDWILETIALCDKED